MTQVWDGLSDIALETCYLDYVSRKELFVIKRVLMNHVREEVVFLNGNPHRILNIETEIDTNEEKDGQGFIRRSFFIAERH